MKYFKNTLKNGLRIITVPMKNTETVTVMVLVKTGSDYETKDINGISHFLEHMCFQGTEKRPNTGDISKELDALGAQSNAFTSKEFTGYWAKAHKKHFPKITEIVSDIYLNSIFETDAIEREKGVVVEEIKMYEDLPQHKVGEVFEELLYGDQSAGRPIIGSEKNVRSFTKEQILNYRDSQYSAPNTIVVVAGGVDSKKALKLASEFFGKVRKGKKNTHKKTDDSQKESAVKIHFKDTDQAHIILGFRSFDVKNKENPKIALLEAVLGRGMSSRLFRKLRDELGICYYVRSGNDTAEDRGFFAIASGLSKDRVKIGIEAILEEIKKIKTELVPESELRKAKDLMIGNMYLSLETSDSLADFYSFQELHGLKIKTPEEKAERIEKITAKDVMNMANKIFNQKTINLSIVGPFKDGKEFKDILKL
ncbi:MAG: pitrilysin family protein [Candidatus Paceibacterota bacterium]